MAKRIGKNCTRCIARLTEDNINSYDYKKQHYICKECSKLKRDKLRASLKEEVFKNYGNKCICCGENNLVFLTIDHISNNGSEHRKMVKTNQIYTWLKKQGYPKDNIKYYALIVILLNNSENVLINFASSNDKFISLFSKFINLF